MEDAIVARLRDAYAALGRGHESQALAMLHPDCEWHESAELPGGTVMRGRDEVARFLREFLQSWGRFDQRIEAVHAADDLIGLAIHLTAVGRTSGIEIDTRYAHVWTVRGGVGVRVDAYRDPDAARDVVERANPQTPTARDDSQKAT